MKNKQRSVLCLSVLSVLSLTSCNPKIPANWADGIIWEMEGQTAYNKLKNEKRKGTYNYYESYMPKSLNSALTMQSEDSRHITNIVDGLVDVDRTGAIIPALATSWAWKDATKQDEITFQIRQNVPWVKNSGNGADIYKDAAGNAVNVSAQDWITATEYAINAANGGSTSYLLTMFIEGAQEYFDYTELRFNKANGYGVITDAKVAERENDKNSPDGKLKDAYKTCSVRVGQVFSPTGTCKNYIDIQALNDDYIAETLGVEKSDFENIANFSRVGIKSSTDGRELTYKLNGTMPYFLTALTYSPYFPINKEFVESPEIGGIEYYGTDRDKILSCGAFVMNNFKMGTSTSIKFRRNQNYWDVKNVHLYEVNAKSIPSTTTVATARRAYESKTIDGFVVNDQDTDGWKKYVTGKDGTGTADNPANPLAHVSEGFGDGSTFALMLNTNRGANKESATVAGTLMGSSDKYNSVDESGNNLEVLNTNKALSVSPAVRKLVLKAMDFEKYLNTEGRSDYERTKTAVNTWIPANFITYSDYDAATDNAEGIMGRDFLNFTKKAYVDKFYSSEYTEDNFKKADAALSYSQISSGEHSLSMGVVRPDPTKWEFQLSDSGEAELATLKKNATSEIKAWNDAHPADTIKTPVVIEYCGLTYNSENDRYDAEWINSTNARLNGCWYGGAGNDGSLETSIGRPEGAKICTDQEESNSIIRYVKNNSTNVPNNDAYSAISAYSAATLIISGWGPDYSDPLTFANTVVTNGDLSANMGMRSSNPYFDEIEKQWGKYDGLVEEANALVDSKARYEKFAEAEIELLFELNILRPVKMMSLGRNVRISKVVPFRITNATYGVSSYKYKYVEVLNRPLTQAEYDTLKAERSVQNKPVTSAEA